MSRPFNILVAGEAITDVFSYGVASRVNPEAPSLVFNPETDDIMPGGAALTATHVKRLDPTSNVIGYYNYSKITKQRFIDKHSGYVLFRVDKGDILPDNDYAQMSLMESCLGRAEIKFEDLNVVLISDYKKGFIREDFVKNLIDKASKFEIPVFLDSKRILGEWSKGAIVKVNYSEYNNLLRYQKNPELYCKNLIVTMGSDGAVLINTGEIFPVHKVETVCLIGAGDLFLSCLALATCKGYSIQDSIKFANKAASLKVQRQGTLVVEGKEIWGDYLDD